MLFRVSEKFKGSFVLSTLKKPLSAGMTVSITEKDMYALDVKSVVKKGILIPLDNKYDKNKEAVSTEAMITNRTDKVLVLGQIVLRPWASLPISKKLIDSISIRAAVENEYIQIISDEDYFYDDEEEEIEEIEEIEEEEEEIVDKKLPIGEDRKVEPVIWDFKQKKTKKAEIIPKTPDIISVDEEKEEEHIEFIDEENPKKIAKKKASKKKASKKKVSKKKIAKKRVSKNSKKKENSKKNKNKKKITKLEPVGEKKLEKTIMDAAIELDSRGNPLSKASDVLQHMIDEIDSGKEVIFTDEEQAQERINNRNQD